MQAVGLSGVVHHLTCHGGLLSAGIAPAVVFLLALILELCTAKVNSQFMDISAGADYKLCRIFMKLNGILTRPRCLLMEAIVEFSGNRRNSTEKTIYKRRCFW